ncbi:MAG: host attachment protein [Thermosynechococcaceae cyanobacterium]
MTHTLVAVLNGTKARFFTLASADFPENEPGPDLIEHETLINEANEMSGQDLWASSKTGRNRGSAGQSHSYDDHRQNHAVAFEQRFSQNIVSQMQALIESDQIRHLILVAEPQMLGIVREPINAGISKTVEVKELAKDLCQFSVRDLHEYLASKKLLPARKGIMRSAV